VSFCFVLLHSDGVVLSYIQEIRAMFRIAQALAPPKGLHKKPGYWQIVRFCTASGPAKGKSGLVGAKATDLFRDV
jgi:hypothetical protein